MILELLLRWEISADQNHFITVNFQDFNLKSADHCATGFLELSDSIPDSDHMRRYCSAMENRKWFTSSNKLFIEYLVDVEDTKSNFALRLDQTRGCVIPQLPPGGLQLDCGYEGNLKIVCKLQCLHEKMVKKLQCTLHYGTWTGDLTCKSKKGLEIRRKPLYILMNCRHQVTKAKQCS